MSSGYLILDKFKSNDERFRNTMEDIFQKYSSLDDTGPDVCFKTMTFRTGKGAVPIESVDAKRAMQRLRSRISAQQSLHNTSVGLHTAKVEHDFSEQEMDVTQITENEAGRSSQMENSLCDDTKTCQLSVSEPHGYTWMEASQPEEDDQDLERTLSSYGSTLLDVYPSMLDQIGKACQRQRATDAASTVLRRYRRRRWQPPRLRGHGTQSEERSTAAVQPLRDDASPRRGKTSVQQAGSVGRSRLELSPCRSVRNSPSASSVCFYSPRRENAEESVVVETGSRHRPVHVLDLLSPSSSSSCSPASDLNQTFDVERVSVPSLQGFPTASVCSPSRPKCNSPQKAVKSLIVGREDRPEISSPSYNSCSGLEQECTKGFLAQERFRNSCCSSAPSVQRALIGCPLPGGRSPLRPRVLSLEQKRQKSSSVYYPNQTLPVDRGDTSVVYRSPHRSQHVLLSSPHYKYQQNLTMAAPHQISPRPTKRWRSLSGHQTMSSSISQKSRRHIDAEFRRIYHHFICQGTSSSCFTSSCHLCERRSDNAVQNRPLSSSSLSALALTPPWSRLKKRRRQPEMGESPRFKRFRESYSPVSRNKQRANTHVSTAMEEPNEAKRTWNRAFLLQCPSPGFLRASESIKKVPGYKLGLPIPQHSPSWIKASSCMGEVEAKSPMRTWNQSGVSPSPSISRRRLLYGPLQ